jgi:tetratricopeptide (TPR) repeat protein
MAELSDEVYEEIKRLCAAGDDAIDAEDNQGAVRLYREAWNLIPAPKTDWQASTWVLGAIADAYLFNRDYQYAKDALDFAMHCPEAIGNPYLHLRLGQACFELGELDKAADELTRAYMGAGSEIFDDQSPKYFEFLQTRIQV